MNEIRYNHNLALSKVLETNYKARQLFTDRKLSGNEGVMETLKGESHLKLTYKQDVED